MTPWIAPTQTRSHGRRADSGRRNCFDRTVFQRSRFDADCFAARWVARGLLLALVPVASRVNQAMVVCFAIGMCLAAGRALAVEPAGPARSDDGAARSDAPAFGLTRRTAWTSSRFRGRPEPPPPLRAERLFPKLSFKNPTVLSSAPGSERLFVAEHDGKVFSIPADPDCAAADLMLDVKELVARQAERQQESLALEAVYGMTFHPRFAENRLCYICYVVRYQDRGRGQYADGTRVVQLQVSDTDPPKCDVASARTVITWLQGGHNGGCLKFGHDGKLYISTGDGGFAFPPDGRNAGQDVSNLLSAVLRIDVDHATDDRSYSIPSDNPFVALPGARGEIWAYGMRNPWKMSFDRETGELWVGDVGWELWELVYRVRKGDNFGWSLVEGRQPVHAERQRGPTPIVPPAVEIPHTDGASVTGGFVYRGKRFPELKGTYVFGDWETRRIWGVPVLDRQAGGDAAQAGPRRDLVEPTVRIVGFAEDHDGELLLLDYDDGTIHGLQRNDAPTSAEAFPRKLSESGIFASVADHQPADGVLPFSINAPQWSDYATAERLVGVPQTGTIQWHSRARRVEGSMFNRSMDFPADTVLTKTLSLEMIQGDPASRRRIETQVLHFDGRDWRGYTYAWNNQQTDAELVPAEGTTRELTVSDSEEPDGKRPQSWRFASRMECIRCHNPWAEHTLAFNIPQLNRPRDFGSVVDNQLRTFDHIGLLREIVAPTEASDSPVEFVEPARDPEQLPRLTDPQDTAADLDSRARSYLHANCAHCHRDGGGGSAYLHLPYTLSLLETKSLSARPTQGAFGIRDAEILAPGDPYRSVLYYRLAKAGPGHMPHIGARLVDWRGLELIHDWIRQLPVRSEDGRRIERLAELDETTAVARERQQAAATRRQLARELARRQEREEPNEEDRREAEKQMVFQAEQRAKQRADERLPLIAELLATPPAAMVLARALKQGRMPDATRRQVLEAAAVQSDLAVRDLFEPLLPQSLRVQRLGETIDADELLAMNGRVEAGRALFHEANGIQCRNCHRIAGKGIDLGPDLSEIGKKYDRQKLLESILQPSRNIDPKFTTWLVESTDGKVLTGLLVSRDADELVLKDAQNKEHRLAADKVEGAFPQRISLMPELLLRDMTAQQVADLLAYLETLK